MSDRTLYEWCDGFQSECRDGLQHLSHYIEAVPCEHGNYEPHWWADSSDGANGHHNVWTECDGKPEGAEFSAPVEDPK